MDWHATSFSDLQHYDPQQVFDAGLALHHIANTAYPIWHTITMRPYRIPHSQVQMFAPMPWQKIERMGLYVHVPFCESRCGFCEYTVVDPALNARYEDLYFDLLLREFELYCQALDTSSKTLIGFDIGGGTPSAAKTTNIGRVVDAARHKFRFPQNVVISIETTPKIAAVDVQKMRAYYEMGIHRISMGVQTVNPRLLEQVGRRATSITYNLAAVENIRAAGFTRFNVDVMYGFAGQSQTSLEATLRHVIELQPEYITLYRMRYKGTRLAPQMQRVSREEVIVQAHLAKEMLLAAGYFGAPGKNTFSKFPDDVGTSDYLTERVIHGTPYLGLGLGAQSLAHTSLAYNCGAADKRLEIYQRRIENGLLPIQDLYHLSLPAAMGKMISVSFYFGEINLLSFQRKFGESLEESFPDEVAFVLRQGLMETCGYQGTGISLQDNATLRLTAFGEQQVNGVIALFYAGAVKKYLLSQAASLERQQDRSPLNADGLTFSLLV